MPHHEQEAEGGGALTQLTDSSHSAPGSADDVEEWRPIPGHDGYDVSDRGRVRSWLPLGRSVAPLRAPRLKSLRVHCRDGYVIVSLVGRPATPVHQLVASAFLGPRPDGHDVCHSDGDRTNNSADNLRYDTRAGNLGDRHAHGTARRPYVRMSLEREREIVRLYQSGLKMSQVARQTGTHAKNVDQVIRRNVACP